MAIPCHSSSAVGCTCALQVGFLVVREKQSSARVRRPFASVEPIQQTLQPGSLFLLCVYMSLVSQGATPPCQMQWTPGTTRSSCMISASLAGTQPQDTSQRSSGSPPPNWAVPPTQHAAGQHTSASTRPPATSSAWIGVSRSSHSQQPPLRLHPHPPPYPSPAPPLLPQPPSHLAPQSHQALSLSSRPLQHLLWSRPLLLQRLLWSRPPHGPHRYPVHHLLLLPVRPSQLTRGRCWSCTMPTGRSTRCATKAMQNAHSMPQFCAVQWPVHM